MIQCYARLGLGKQLAILCDDSLKRRGNEATTVFWKAYAAAREGTCLLIGPRVSIVQLRSSFLLQATLHKPFVTVLHFEPSVRANMLHC